MSEFDPEYKELKRCLKGVSLKGALDILYGDDEDIPDIDAIYITPPDTAVLTDEESGDEESKDPNRFSSNQLRAEAEVRFSIQNNADVPDDEEIDLSIDFAPTAVLVQPPTATVASCSRGRPIHPVHNSSKVQSSPTTNAGLNSSTASKSSVKIPPMKKTTGERKWLQGEFSSNMPHFPIMDQQKYEKKSSTDLFELFLSDDIFSLLVEETRKYAMFKNCPDPNITKSEIKCFVAILILSGYNRLPALRYYWDGGKDMGVQLVKESMRKNRFEQIFRFLHCADNNSMDLTDKLWKIRPMIKKVQENCMKHYIPDKNCSYDESMVKYYGRHSLRQFIRGKPVRFGYKVWSLNAANGYLINFEVYQGKSIRANTTYEQYFGKCAAPLLCMIDEMPDPMKCLPMSFYFDNLFTSLPLISHLRERGYGATGTIRANRVPASANFATLGEMKKKERGYFQSKISMAEGAVVVRWKDNSVVTLASNEFGVEPIRAAKRYSRNEKKIIAVQQPDLIYQYNQHMGGTDRMDQNIGQYRIKLRSKKWYWPLLTWLIDVCVQNAWQISRRSKPELKQLDFRREIVTTLLLTNGTSAKGGGRPKRSLGSLSGRLVPDSVRYSEGAMHLVKKIAEGKKQRCNGEGCSSIMRTMCTTCAVPLCLECFEIFHKVTY